MSLYSEYVKEREDIDTYETKNWFFMYKIENNDLVVLDGYISKKYRKGKAILNMLRMIFNLANSKKCDTILMQTDTTTNNWKSSDRLIKKLGFNHILVKDNINYYIKELGE